MSQSLLPRGAQEPTDPLAPILAARERFFEFLARRVGDREAAEDILQAALLRATERASELHAHESITAWFYRVLRNAVVDHFRARARAGERTEAYVREVTGFHSAEMEPAFEAEACRCLVSLVDTLKPEYADVLHRVELDGMSVKDYADAREITANLAGVRAFRARNALRRQLIACCGGCADNGCKDCDCPPR